VKREITRIEGLIGQAGTDPGLLREAAYELRELHRARQLLAEFVATRGGEIVRRAILAGVAPEALFDAPYEASTVRRLAREAGIPKRRPGPKSVKR